MVVGLVGLVLVVGVVGLVVVVGLERQTYHYKKKQLKETHYNNQLSSLFSLYH